MHEVRGLKVTHIDGREMIYRGGTHEVLNIHNAPDLMGTFNYIPMIRFPSDPNPLNLLEFGVRAVGHGLVDLLPYYIGGNVRGPG